MDYVVSVEDIAKELGATIDEYPFEHQDGVIIQDGDRYRVGVRDDLDSYHKRFAIAHELGHLKDHSVGNSYSLIDERRATKEGIDLLVDSEKLREALDFYGEDCEFLHCLFGVSVEVMAKKVSSF